MQHNQVSNFTTLQLNAGLEIEWGEHQSLVLKSRGFNGPLSTGSWVWKSFPQHMKCATFGIITVIRSPEKNRKTTIKRNESSDKKKKIQVESRVLWAPSKTLHVHLAKMSQLKRHVAKEAASCDVLAPNPKYTRLFSRSHPKDHHSWGACLL